MSRVGNKPIPLPQGVGASVQDSRISIKGPKGELSWAFKPEMRVRAESGQVVVEDPSGGTRGPLHGTTRAIIACMVQGVSRGYERELEIEGVGYRCALQGGTLVLNVGFSHPIEFPVPAGIKIEVADGVRIKVSGLDKQQVGDTAARIRAYQKAEPYKGKGIKYKGEQIRRKAGKTVA